MTWLLFIDESGHDHKNLPLEVRGGVAIHVGKLWPFIQQRQRLEQDSFGVLLADFGKEAKGMKLLAKDRFRWTGQTTAMDPSARRKHARSFLNRGQSHGKPTSTEFAAYGQACLEMARGAFDLLTTVDARLFACAINRRTRPPPGYANAEFLRKDHVFLFERFYYFLHLKAAHGLIVMDRSEKEIDSAFVRRMELYFTRTSVGRNRAFRIVPAPLFVSSDMTYAVQAADICLYGLNWGFRPPSWGNIERRDDISAEFGPKLARLQWEGEGEREWKVFHSRGIVHVPDPYGEEPASE